MHSSVSRRQSFRLWGLLILLTGLVVACGSGTKGPGTLKHRPAADFTLRDLSGKNVSLADYKGSVVLLDFWATWCPPCRVSIPEIQKLYDEYSPRGLNVLGVSVDEDFSVVGPFVNDQKMTYPILLAGESDIPTLYDIRGIPALFLIDKEGHVVREWVGYDPELPHDWRKAIEPLLTS